MPVTVSQILTPGITLLDAGGGNQSGNTLTWYKTVSASALSVVTFTFSYPAMPGTGNTLPGANLALICPLDGQPLTTTANTTKFSALWPFTLHHSSPDYVLPGSSANVVISLTNWLTSSIITGSITISVTDALAVPVYAQSQPFNVAANTTGASSFTLPNTLASGNYAVRGVVSASGASASAFVDALQVGLPGPLIDYRVSPLGAVHPNDTLTYTIRFTNSAGVPLSGAVLTASLPVSVTILNGSISGGGVVMPGQVRWTLGSVAVGQPVLQSFAVRVNADAAPAGSGPTQLLSGPLLTANEVAPTSGPLVWNLVSRIYDNYLPVIDR